MLSMSASNLITAWEIRVEWELPSRPVVWVQRRVALPTDRWVVVARRSKPDVAIEMDVVSDHCGPHCKGLRASGDTELRSGDLRMIPVGRLMRASAMRLAMEIVDNGPAGLALEPPSRAIRSEDLPEVANAPHPRGRRRGKTVEQAAELYRREQAKGNHRHYRRAIAEEMGYTEGYVAQLIYRARRRSLLEPVSQPPSPPPGSPDKCSPSRT